MTSKDTSKKIRSILKDKKTKGQFIGSTPCFGYMRDPLDKGHLIPNPETAPIVRRIFDEIAKGEKISDVIDRFNKENISTPSKYKGLKKSARQINGDIWTVSCINKILKNRMYTGDMIQNVQAKLSYKSNKRISLSSNYWIIVPNTHEPLVSREAFEKIQNTPSRTRKTKRGRDKRLLEGLIYCKECGNALTVSYRELRDYWTINCNKYSRSPRQKLCTPHFFPYNKFEEAVLFQVRQTCKENLSKINIKELSKTVAENERNKDIPDKTYEIKDLKLNISELQRKINSLYEDKFNGIISTDTYVRLSKETEDKIKAMNSKIVELENKVDKSEKIDLIALESKIKKLINIKKPNRDLLFAIIKKIEVDDNKNIEIIYNFS